jgi:hypothetical protein
MKPSIVRVIKTLGNYRVYQSGDQKTYCHFTNPEGTHIGYAQYNPIDGYTICTVHKPNSKSGTGFQIVRRAESITQEDLENALYSTPNWAKNYPHEKYKNWEAFTKKSQCAWTEQLREPMVTVLRGPTGNPTPQQLNIVKDDGEYFQSYDVIVGKKDYAQGRIILDSKYWKYSKTTIKYRNIWAGLTTDAINTMVSNGTILLEDLNT